jgi:RNA polymerase sigma factor (sigma-70 family)
VKTGEHHCDLCRKWDLFDVAYGVGFAEGADGIEAQVELAVKETQKAQPVRVGVGAGSYYVGNGRVPIVPAEIPWPEKRRFIRAKTYSNIPGWGAQRSTRAANVNSREMRGLLTSATPPGCGDSESSIEQLAIDPDPSPEDQLALGEHSNRLLRQLRLTAPERQRQIIELRLEGYSLTDAARALGICPSTARVHWHRLLRRARAKT